MKHGHKKKEARASRTCPNNGNDRKDQQGDDGDEEFIPVQIVDDGHSKGVNEELSTPQQVHGYGSRVGQVKNETNGPSKLGSQRATDQVCEFPPTRREPGGGGVERAQTSNTCNQKSLQTRSATRNAKVQHETCAGVLRPTPHNSRETGR